MNDILCEVIIAIISVLGTVISYRLIPYIKTKYDTEKLVEYKTWTDLAVRSAEMLYTEKGSGKTKKEYVVEEISKIINKNKVLLTDEQINMIIEASVKSLHIEEGLGD